MDYLTEHNWIRLSTIIKELDIQNLLILNFNYFLRKKIPNYDSSRITFRLQLQMYLSSPSLPVQSWNDQLKTIYLLSQQ